MGNSRIKIRLALSALLAVVAGVAIASIAGAQAPPTYTPSTSTASNTTSTTSTTRPRGNQVRFCLRFDRLRLGSSLSFDVHCHRRGCLLAGKGTIRIAVGSPGERQPTAVRKFKLGKFDGATGRNGIARMKLRLPAAARAAVNLVRQQGGQVRASLVVKGTMSDGSGQRTKRRTINVAKKLKMRPSDRSANSHHH